MAAVTRNTFTLLLIVGLFAPSVWASEEKAACRFDGLKKKGGPGRAIELRGFWNRVVQLAQEEVDLRKLSPESPVSSAETLIAKVAAEMPEVVPPSGLGSSTRWLSAGMSAGDFDIRNKAITKQRASRLSATALKNSEQYRGYVLTLAALELEALKADPKLSLSTSEDFTQSLREKFPEAKAFHRSAIIKWIDGGLNDTQKAERSARLEKQRKASASSFQNKRAKDELVVLKSLVEAELIAYQADPKTVLRTMEELGKAIHEKFPDKRVPSFSQVAKWLPRVLSESDRALRKKAMGAQTGAAIGEAQSAPFKELRSKVIAKVKAEIESNREDSDQPLSSFDEISAAFGAKPDGTPNVERSTVGKWLKKDLSKADFDYRNGKMEAVRVANVAEAVRDHFQNRSENIREFVANLIVKEQADVAKRLPVYLMTNQEILKAAKAAFPEEPLHQDTITEIIRANVADWRVRRKQMKAAIAARYPESVRNFVLEQARENIAAHRAGTSRLLFTAEQIAAATRTKFPDDGKTVAEHLVHEWLRDGLSSDDLEYRFSNRSRHRPTVVWKGIYYDSIEEAVVAEHLKMYLGFEPEKRVNLQILLGQREVDFRIGDTFIEYHRILLYKDANGRGDFENVEEARLFAEELAKIPEHDSKARAVVRKAKELELANRYYAKRLALIHEQPEYTKMRLVVLTSPDDLYDKLIAPSQPKGLPSRKEFLKRFFRLARTVKAEAAATEAEKEAEISTELE